MGKRFYIGILLLILMLALGFTGLQTTRRICVTAARDLQQAQQLSLRGNFSQAVAIGQQTAGRWKKSRVVLMLLADHTPLDEMDMLFAELDIYGSTGEIPHFAACCAQLQTLCTAMVDAHRPLVQNLL